MHPVQKLVMARVSADFDSRQVQLKEKEVNDLLDEGDDDGYEESVSQSNNELIREEENEAENGKGIRTHNKEEEAEQHNCETSFTESDHLVDVREVGEEEESTYSHTHLVDEDYDIVNTLKFSSLSVQDKLEHDDYGSGQEDKGK